MVLYHISIKIFLIFDLKMWKIRISEIDSAFSAQTNFYSNVHAFNSLEPQEIPPNHLVTNKSPTFQQPK